jgi:hypothetical protein
MKEPRRLRQTGADRITTALLEAGRTDGPPKARLDRMLGIGGGAGVALAANAAAGSAGAAAPVAKSALGVALVIKWLGVGALAGGVVSAGAARILPSDVRETSIAPSPQPSVDERRASLPAAPARLGEPLTVAEPAEAEPTPVHRAEPRVGSAPVHAPVRAVPPRETPVEPPLQPVTPESADQPRVSPEALALREEVVALGRAKAALNRGAAAEALAVIRDYRSRFPLGRLGPEATYIEMEAELASGNRARAESIAERLATGTTPNAERARAILKGGKP